MQLFQKNGLLLVALLGSLLNVSAQQTNAPIPDSIRVVKPGATLQQVSSQFTFTEGPAVDKAGTVYFTDQPNDKIWMYDTQGKLTVFMDKTGRSNGLYFDKKGNLIACADQNNELWSITPQKSVTVLMNDYQGKNSTVPMISGWMQKVVSTSPIPITSGTTGNEKPPISTVRRYFICPLERKNLLSSIAT